LVNVLGRVDLLLIALTFLSFHTVQLTSMVREAMALWFGIVLKDILLHHSLMEMGDN
jgi:hypothetical protein